MKIAYLKPENATEYNDFVLKHPDGTIHQLWEWGEFQVQSGTREKFWVIVLKNANGHIVASSLVVKQKLPFGKSWLYSPRGPLLDDTKPEETEGAVGAEKIFDEIAALAKKEDAVFFRFDPGIEQGSDRAGKAESLFGMLKSRPSHAHYQPESTLFVDLKPSPEDILKQMKPKGRYNIKIAQKHGVAIRISDGNSTDVKAFYGLLSQTTERDRFSGHPQQYYKKMLDILGSEKAKLYLAEYAETGDDSKNRKSPQILAAAIVTWFGDTATYYFGASSNENRNVMAPYLLHWQALLGAKSSGFHTYDFFGIAPENSPKHPWASVTEFKLKFGGKRVKYIDAQEIVYRPFWYGLVMIAKKIKSFL